MDRAAQDFEATAVEAELAAVLAELAGLRGCASAAERLTQARLERDELTADLAEATEAVVWLRAELRALCPAAVRVVSPLPRSNPVPLGFVDWLVAGTVAATMVAIAGWVVR